MQLYNRLVWVVCLVYVKGCDPENLREYIVGASKIHQINGMDQDTITRLYPEMQ
jgi:hypothetical protein